MTKKTNKKKRDLDSSGLKVLKLIVKHSVAVRRGVVVIGFAPESHSCYKSYTASSV